MNVNGYSLNRHIKGTLFTIADILEISIKYPMASRDGDEWCLIDHFVTLG